MHAPTPDKAGDIRVNSMHELLTVHSSRYAKKNASDIISYYYYYRRIVIDDREIAREWNVKK